MSRNIKIGDGYNNVAMPGKGAPVLDEGDTYTISDVDFASMQSAGVVGPTSMIVDLGFVDTGGGTGGGITVESDPIASAALNTHKTSGDHDTHYTAAAHTSATDPHGDRAAATSALATHKTSADHDTRYDAAGTASAAVAAHSTALDVHGDRSYADSRIALLVNAAPAALDTLAEIDAQMASDETGAAAMQASINTKAAQTDLTAETTRAQNAEAANTTSINNHVNKVSAAHAASAVSVSPSGLAIITTTDVQAALAQLDAATAAAGVPSGPAGGALAGTYPNPALAAGSVTDAAVAAGAAIAASKVALVNDGGFTSPTQRTASFMTHRRRKANTVTYGPIGTRIAGSIVVSAGLCYFDPIHVERPLTIGNLLANVITAATAGHLTVGVYGDDGQGHPTGAPLFTSAAQLATATGVKTIAANLAITTPDIYWLAVLMENDITGSPALADYAPNYDAPQVCYQSGLTTTLPNPVGALTESGSATWPVLTYTVSAFT